ncbi:hypothetical protein [Dietzia sp. PP-33]|jgi:hypothetical protein|uniref:hypothetical protein n=1 Tax=Dietzia sp. PP-33 TaxID=2957500 RepID=UPI0029A79EA6|nr:hypothetical protein [Dietzia sp. PP-33]MDX2358369.1 hypothetical protein [Dietzia sp. PP-33]
MVSGDSGSSAASQSGEGILRAVLVALVPVVGVFAGIVIGWYTITWAVQTFRDVFEVPELSPVPVQDRAPGVPGPTVRYWLSWAVPLVVFCVASALLWWGWRRGRLLTGSVMAGFSAVVVLLAPLWVSIEVGGFAPS